MLLAVLAIGVLFRRGMSDASGGQWISPLDDAYIHFQYAKLFARGEPFAWSPGGGYTTGATSPVWVLLLAIPSRLGASGNALSEVAFVLGGIGFVVCGLLLIAELERASPDRFSATLGALAALCGGAVAWGFFSGMEVALCAICWLIACRVLERWSNGHPPDLAGTCFLALLPLVRPEGLVGPALALWACRAAPRSWRKVPFLFAPWVAYCGLNAALTGHPLPSGAAVKSLFAGGATLSAALSRLWTNLVLVVPRLTLEPFDSPAALFPVGVVAAVAGWGLARRARQRDQTVVPVFLLAVLGLSFGNRFVWMHHERYLLPLAPLAAISAARVLGRLGVWAIRSYFSAALVVAGVWMPFAARVFSADVFDIAHQQVPLGHFIAEHLPKDARVALNDAGAIAYFGERRMIDLIGLGTNGLAEANLAGPGALFKALTRLPPDQRPTHFAVYPEWVRLDPLLGQELFRAELPRNYISGARLAVLAEARTELLAPPPVSLDPAAPAPCDSLDVGNLASERNHAATFSPRLDALLFSGSTADRANLLDGGRPIGTARFRLECRGRSRLRARLFAPVEASVSALAQGQPLGRQTLRPGWNEVVFPVPGRESESVFQLDAEPGAALARVNLEPAE